MLQCNVSEQFVRLAPDSSNNYKNPSYFRIRPKMSDASYHYNNDSDFNTAPDKKEIIAEPKKGSFASFWVMMEQIRLD